MGFYGDREIMEGYLPWDDGNLDPDGVILVRGRRATEVGRNQIDHTAEILTGDAPDSLTAFDESEALYQGIDRTATPTYDFNDGDPSKY